MQNEKGFDLAGRSVFIALPAYDFKVSLKLAETVGRLFESDNRHQIPFDNSVGYLDPNEDGALLLLRDSRSQRR